MYMTNKCGISLIEVVLAIAILGLIAISMLSMFTSGFGMITRAGWHSASTYGTQADVEMALTNKSMDLVPGIDIKFSPSDKVTAEGKPLTLNHTINGVVVNIHVFQPAH